MKYKALLFCTLAGLFQSCKSQDKDAVNHLDSVAVVPQEQTAIIYEKAKNFPNESHLSFNFRSWQHTIC